MNSKEFNVNEDSKNKLNQKIAGWAWENLIS